MRCVLHVTKGGVFVEKVVLSCDEEVCGCHVKSVFCFVVLNTRSVLT